MTCYIAQFLKKKKKKSKKLKCTVYHVSQTFQVVEAHWDISTYLCLHSAYSEMAKFLLEAAGACEMAVKEGDFEGEESLLVNHVQSPDQNLYLFHHCASPVLAKSDFSGKTSCLDVRITRDWKHYASL